MADIRYFEQSFSPPKDADDASVYTVIQKAMAQRVRPLPSSSVFLVTIHTPADTRSHLVSSYLALLSFGHPCVQPLFLDILVHPALYPSIRFATSMPLSYNQTESAKQYLSAERKDLADKESSEADFIKQFLPTPLSSEEVCALPLPLPLIPGHAWSSADMHYVSLVGPSTPPGSAFAHMNCRSERS
jgi:hypothetical protein